MNWYVRKNTPTGEARRALRACRRACSARAARSGGERGQTATEYVLIIAVVVLGLLAASSYLIPNMKSGVDALSGHLTTRFESNPDDQQVDNN